MKKPFILTTIVFVSTMSIIPISLVTSCSSVKNSTSDNEINDSTPDKVTDANDFFPDLYVDDYYDYVEFDNDANPVIGDKFIMKVIEDVVSRVSSSTGEIQFSVVRYSDSVVDFNFKWISDNVTLYKTYTFELKKAGNN